MPHTEVLPSDVAQIALDAYRAAGYQVGQLPHAGASRYATFALQAPNGQQFRIQVEEQ
jgi:hypothetical protein